MILTWTIVDRVGGKSFSWMNMILIWFENLISWKFTDDLMENKNFAFFRCLLIDFGNSWKQNVWTYDNYNTLFEKRVYFWSSDQMFVLTQVQDLNHMLGMTNFEKPVRLVHYHFPMVNQDDVFFSSYCLPHQKNSKCKQCMKGI